MHPDLSLDDVAAALTAIDASCARDDWVKVGTALKSEFGEAGFAVWDDWSATGGNYDARETKGTWRSLRPGSVGLGWLINVAKARGHKFARPELSADERKARKAAQRKRRAELEAQAQADGEALAAWQRRVAEACLALDREHLADSGKSDYLQRKKVGAYGLRFVSHGVVVLTHLTDQRIELISGRDDINRFFERQRGGELDAETTSFKYLKYGTIAVPLRDADGALWAFQFVNATGSKQFLKFGRKQGLWHLVTSEASIEAEKINIFGVAEGYATAASVHQATGWPVAVAFDAGNLKPVCEALRRLYPDARLVVCGDDDHANPKNPGRAKAQAAAAAVGGVALWPDFSQLAPA
jgi:putative DNA primase/helicase